MGDSLDRGFGRQVENVVGEKIRVVIADDLVMFRRIVRLLLDSDDRFVVVAEVADGADAIRVCGAEQPDAILLDLVMPVLTGLQAIPLIRACSPATSIIVFSAFAGTQVEPMTLSSGADAFLEKHGQLMNIKSTIAAIAVNRGCASHGVSQPSVAAA